MVVDVGGGTTEVAVIALGGMVVWQSLHLGGFDMDEAIVAHAKRERAVELGESRAEQIKIEIGSASPLAEEEEVEVTGRDLLSGQLRRTRLGTGEVRAALAGTVTHIIEAVTQTLERTPPELAADITERGIVLAGGGVLLRGFPDRLSAETGLSVHLVDEPLTCVASGAGRCLSQLDVFAHSERFATRGRLRSSRKRMLRSHN